MLGVMESDLSKVTPGSVFGHLVENCNVSKVLGPKNIPTGRMSWRHKKVPMLWGLYASVLTCIKSIRTWDFLWLCRPTVEHL